MSTRHYYRRLLQIFWSYKRKKTRLSYMPVRLWVEPTSHCNLLSRAYYGDFACRSIRRTATSQ